MEYENHIKRLVLGYLKTECKNSYKVFLKSRFQIQHKHIATRVAGQTLEDILKIYSRVQDIVQGRLEDTDYYKEHGTDFGSPLHLAEQLLYLLDKNRPYTPVSTLCGRSPGASSVAETHNENQEVHSDVETTPEHSLPGNMPSNDNESSTPFRKRSPVFRTPFMEQIPSSEHGNLSSVMASKLLEKKDFHEKLARNINTALNTPELSNLTRKGECDLSKIGLAELEDTIKKALNRTEADPVFEDLLQDFLDPIASTIDKVINDEPGASSSRSSTPTKECRHVEEQNNGTVSSILAISTATSNTKTRTPIINVIQNEIITTSQSAKNAIVNGKNETLPPHQMFNRDSSIQHISSNITSSESLRVNDAPSSSVQKQYDNTVLTQPIVNSTNPVYNIPASNIGQSSNQQQQFYILNQPLMMHPMQVIRPLQSVCKPVIMDPNPKILPKFNTNLNLSEHDIMNMPTIILNDRNEVTYTDVANTNLNTPYKLNEVQNIKEYFNVFGANDQSPLIKQVQKKHTSKLKPTPTIKVEIYQRDSPLSTTEEASKENKSTSKTTSDLPNLSDFCEVINIENHTKDCSNKEVPKLTPSEKKIESNDKAKPKSLSSVFTPSPLVTAVRKPTPKSGSHVRNLTFPSPLRKTPNEPEADRSSPSALNRQQATKDLFNNKPEEKDTIIRESRKTPKRKCKNVNKVDIKKESLKERSPKKPCKEHTKEGSPPKKQKMGSPKKVMKSAKKVPKNENVNKDSNTVKIKTCESWDAALRKNLPVSDNEGTPVRRSKKRPRRSTELDISDGKKLEEALKTPGKPDKTKGKTPCKKKPAKSDNPSKPETKLVHFEEEFKADCKKILSPSKLCNTASKRNMEVDGITPKNPKETTTQLVSNARKNITCLLETPFKDDVPSTLDVTLEPANTPFTPMLKANLKGITSGDNFSIDTPDFPVTPGLNLIENSGTAYCILNETETNKETEAIVLSEERKSSVRKTDDEDFVLPETTSPRISNCNELREEFLKNQMGKKNLELLDNNGVGWDGSSDREYKSDNSDSDEETNSTIIQNTKPTQPVETVRRSSRIGGKSMAILKSSLLDKDKEPVDVSLEISFNEESVTETKDNEIKYSKEVNIFKAKKLKAPSSSSDSEIISKDTYNNKKAVNNKNKNVTCKTNRTQLDNIIEDEPMKNTEVKNTVIREDTKKNNNKSNSISVKDRDNQNRITDITSETIKETISSAPVVSSSGLSTAFSLKEEMDQKRKRLIELEKSKLNEVSKTPSRRKSLKPQNVKSHGNKCKGKRSTPLTRQTREEQIDEIGHDGQVDSQDEFFKKSGTNLHRTNKQSVLDSKKGIEEEIYNNIEIKEKNVPKKANCDSSESISKNNYVETTASFKQSQKETHKDHKSLVQTPIVQNQYDGEEDEYRVIELQAEARRIVYDERNACKKSLEDYDFSYLKKAMQLTVPTEDGAEHIVHISVSPFNELFEMKSSIGQNSGDDATSLSVNISGTRQMPDSSSDSENAFSKGGDADHAKCKKRKHRSDSNSSTSSTKKIKTSLLSNQLKKSDIETVLDKIHGPLRDKI